MPTIKEGEELDVNFQSELILHRTTRDLYEPYRSDVWDPIPLLNFLVEENHSIKTISVELKKVIDESRVQFITGSLDINSDADWKAYVDSLESIGMPKPIETYQTAYDRRYKN